MTSYYDQGPGLMACDIPAVEAPVDNGLVNCDYCNERYIKKWERPDRPGLCALSPRSRDTKCCASNDDIQRDRNGVLFSKKELGYTALERKAQLEARRQRIGAGWEQQQRRRKAAAVGRANARALAHVAAGINLVAA